MRFPSLVLPLSLFVLAACGDDGSSDGDETGTEGTTAADTTMGFPTTDTSPTEASVTEATDVTMSGTTTEGESGPGTTETTATSGVDSSTGAGTGGGDVCESDAADDECYACQKENCCEAMMACVAADANCACVLDCLAALDNPGPQDASTCAEECNADYVIIVPALMMLATCEAEMCGGNNECGGGQGGTN